jgi:hypothetical protein
MITREGIGGGVPFINHSYEDVGIPFEWGPSDCHEKKKDGARDLTIKFMV